MLRKFKAATLSAAVVVGVLGASQVASADLPIIGDWTGTYQFTSPPQVLSDDTMIITEETNYSTSPQPINISFEPGTGGNLFNPVIDNSYFDNTSRRLVTTSQYSDPISHEPVYAWSDILADEINGVMTDIARTDWRLILTDDLAQQHLDGSYTSTFLIGSMGESAVPAAFSEDEGAVDYFATSGNLAFSRSLPEVDPPTPAVPLPPAFSAGLAVLGGLGVIGLVRQRRRAMA